MIELFSGLALMGLGMGLFSAGLTSTVREWAIWSGVLLVLVGGFVLGLSSVVT